MPTQRDTGSNQLLARRFVVVEQAAATGGFAVGMLQSDNDLLRPAFFGDGLQFAHSGENIVAGCQGLCFRKCAGQHVDAFLVIRNECHFFEQLACQFDIANRHRAGIVVLVQAQVFRVRRGIAFGARNITAVEQRPPGSSQLSSSQR